MQTTIDIDEDVLQRARFSGRTTNAVIAEVLRQGLGIETIQLPTLRNGLPQIRFDPAFEPTPDAILDLLGKIEEADDLGPPMFIPTETRKWIDQKAAERQTSRGKLASALAQESLLAQDKWPTRHGVPQILRRSNDSTVITMESIDQLMDELD